MQHNPRFMFHVDMGGGKTRTILEHIKLRGKKEKVQALVLVPFITATETWVAECKKHTPELICHALTGSIEQNKTSLLMSEADIFVMCYQSAVALVTGREDHPTKEGKKKWVLDPSVVREHFSSINMLVLDEIQKCSNIHSLTYKMCLLLSKQSSHVYGLTGTPFGNDLQDLWPQFNLIDFGQTLGPTLGLYRAVFFNEKQNYWGGYEYKFKKKMLPDLTRVIKNKSIRYAIEELVDLPELLRVPIHLELPESVEGYVQKAMEQLREAQKADDYHVIEQNYLKLRQLSSGFLTLKGEDNERTSINFDPNPKLDALGVFVSDLPDMARAVIFHHFVHSGHLITTQLDSLGIKYAAIYGGSKDQVGELRRFQEDPDCRVLVINSKSGSSSLNLQVANYVCFFEQPDSPIDRQQAERRVWRPGQTKKVIIYDLFVRGTYDQRIYDSNAAGRSLLKELLDKEDE